MRRTNSRMAPLMIVWVALAVAACGGSSKSSTTRSAPTTTPSHPSAAAGTASSGSGTVAAVRTGPVHGTLRGANHDPVVKRNWTYSVTATDASGHPLSGTVDIQFVYGGQVVGRDTPPTHPLKNGRWHDNLEFPPASVGVPLTFQAVVHTSVGSITLNWPIEVKQ
jgi:hypothetical protein